MDGLAVTTNASSFATSETRLARIPDRIFASVFDGIAYLPIWFTTPFIFIRWYHIPVPPGGKWGIVGGPALSTIVLDVVCYCAYFVVLEGWLGSTLGKEIMGIEVRTGAGGKCGVRRALVRNLLRPVDAIGFYLLGFLVMLFSPQNLRIGDRVAGTLVVENPHARRWSAFCLWIITTALLMYLGGALKKVLCSNCI